MPPTPIELREQARIYREAARNAASDDRKHRLANCALALAQIAEAVEGEDRIVPFLASTGLPKLLASVDDEVRQVIEELIKEQRAEAATAEQIRRWRMRAAELHAVADQFSVPSAQENLRRAAANYETLADNAERSLAGRPAAPGEKSG